MKQSTRETQQARFFEELRRTGGPLYAVAKRLGVKKETAYRWARRQGYVRGKKAEAPVGFAQLVRASSVVVPWLMVKVGVATIRVDRGFDAEHLRAVVDVLGEGLE